MKSLSIFLLQYTWFATFAFAKLNTNPSAWQFLSFDSRNFLCSTYDTFCDSILSELGCSSNSSYQVIKGCAEPATNLANDYVGECTCLSPIYITSAGLRVTQELIVNRIAADIHWMLEPWNTGPPYDFPQSFEDICETTLHRLGCPAENMTINATAYAISSSGAKIQNAVCDCGKLTSTVGTMVSDLIMDDINKYNSEATPVFADPIYLSVPMSICVTLIAGKLGAIIAVYLKLPPIIGFLLTGLAIQNILNPMFLKGAGFPFPSPASEIKLIALIIVLMRAGLSIKLDEIRATILPTSLLSTLPYFAEFFIWLYAGQTFFHWDIISMGLWASIMAPIGPSVVISTMLQLTANKKKDHGYPPKQTIITTPIEAVIAIVLFGIFSNLEQTSRSTLYPWVTPLPLYVNCLLIPVNLLFSTVLGVVVGLGCSYYIAWRSKIRTDYIWVRVNKNPQMGSSIADLVFVLVVACYTMMSLCVQQYIQQASGVLVVFIAAITVSITTPEDIVVQLAAGLKSIWIFAEVFLFTLTGTSLSFNDHNGPLYGQRGLGPSAIAKVISVLFIGTAGRLFALAICMLILYPTLPKHRQELKWIVPFWIVIWIFQLPKATVQATLGTVPETQHTIPGVIGVTYGLFIAQTTAFAVLIFAPLGTILISFVGSPISVYLTQLDKEAGWKQEYDRYSRKSPYFGDRDVAVLTKRQRRERSASGVPVADVEAEIPLSESQPSLDDMAQEASGKEGQRHEEEDDGLQDPETIDHFLPHARTFTKDVVEYLIGDASGGEESADEGESGRSRTRQRSLSFIPRLKRRPSLYKPVAVVARPPILISSQNASIVQEEEEVEVENETTPPPPPSSTSLVPVPDDEECGIEMSTAGKMEQKKNEDN